MELKRVCTVAGLSLITLLWVGCGKGTDPDVHSERITCEGGPPLPRFELVYMDKLGDDFDSALDSLKKEITRLLVEKGLNLEKGFRIEKRTLWGRENVRLIDGLWEVKDEKVHIIDGLLEHVFEYRGERIKEIYFIQTGPDVITVWEAIDNGKLLLGEGPLAAIDMHIAIDKDGNRYNVVLIPDVVFPCYKLDDSNEAFFNENGIYGFYALDFCPDNKYNFSYR